MKKASERIFDAIIFGGEAGLVAAFTGRKPTPKAEFESIGDVTEGDRTPEDNEVVHEPAEETAPPSERDE